MSKCRHIPNCPNGEEPQILQANSELVDAEFLQVCKGVVTELAETGKERKSEKLAVESKITGHCDKLIIIVYI